MTDTTNAFDAWVNKARAVPIEHEVVRRGIQLNGGKVEHCGPCPRCGGVDRFSINTKKGVWNCRGCDKGGDVIDLVEHLDGVDFIAACTTLAGPRPKRDGAAYPPNNRATVQPGGLTLEQYSAAKALSIDFLREHGLSDMTFAGRSAVRIAYLGANGEELAVRFRIALAGDRFRWKSGSKPCLYGLNRIGDAKAAGYVVLVEGESDVHTLWQHGIPAIGLPGATSWREDRNAEWFDGIETIYVVIEPDKGGHSVRKWLAQSAIRARARQLQLSAKDPSAMHITDPAGFTKAWQVALLGAIPWTAMEANERVEERAEAWESCANLARAENILAEFDRALGTVGLVGERQVAKLIYLAVTSRLSDRPVSIAVKGPSSGGKSFTVESVLRFFPCEAFYALTAMSDRALAYSTEPLKHRHLVIYEAAGMASDFATYLIRSLLSEGRLRYETVEKTRDGLVPKLIEREGPTGLIVTTTSVRLHPENETRMLSLTVSDTREQTAAVFRALANGGTHDVDLSQWRALQTWLATSNCQVDIPFAARLAEMVSPVAIRLRRDLKTVFTLIRAHALLHQASRRKDAGGRLVAEVSDYAAVRELVAELVAEGAEVAIKPEVRETVQAVATLLADGANEVKHSDIKRALRLDKSVVSRRVTAAVDAGFLRNLEDRKGRPARLVIGDPLPEEVELLPQPQRLHGCTVDEVDKPAPVQCDQEPVSPHGGPNGHGAGLISDCEAAIEDLGERGELVSDGDRLDLPAFLDRRAEANRVCAQCGAGRPDDLPTVAATAKNGATVYVHAHGCLKFWLRENQSEASKPGTLP
jgi:hypothetical protein